MSSSKPSPELAPPATAQSVRFTALVQQSGTPAPYAPWVDPQRDPALQAAVRAQRVLTIQQPPAGGKDYGQVGYYPGPQATWLIFPRTLRPFAGRKVVGIKYDLLAQPRPEGPLVRLPDQPPPPPVTPESSPAYRVTVRCTATLDVTETVSAANSSAAKAAALQAVSERDPDFSGAAITRRVVKVERA